MRTLISSLQISGTHCSHRLYLPILSVCLSTYCFHHSSSYSSLRHTITTLLQTNRYVIVYALDFSKAFDSVRHSAVLDKYLQLEMPDNIYNWIESFFCYHSLCTSFGIECSEFQKIMASIIQGSDIGPASYVVTATMPRRLATHWINMPMTHI